MASTMPGYEKVRDDIEEKMIEVTTGQPFEFWEKAIHAFPVQSKVWSIAVERILQCPTNVENVRDLLYDANMPRIVRDAAFETLLGEAEKFEDWHQLFCYIWTTKPKEARFFFELMIETAVTVEHWREIVAITACDSLILSKSSMKQLHSFALQKAFDLAETFEDLSQLFDVAIENQKWISVYIQKLQALSGVSKSGWFGLMQALDNPASSLELTDLHIALFDKFCASTDVYWNLVNLFRHYAPAHVGILKNIAANILNGKGCFKHPLEVLDLLDHPSLTKYKDRFLQLWHEHDLPYEECERLFNRERENRFSGIILERLFELAKTKTEELTVEQFWALILNQKNHDHAAELLELAFDRFSFDDCLRLCERTMREKFENTIMDALFRKAKTFREYFIILDIFELSDQMRSEIHAQMALCVNSNRLE